MAAHINNINSLKGLALCHLNCRSLYYKLDEIKVLYDRFDFMGFSESWLDNGIDDGMVVWSGRSIFRLDRVNNHGGGGYVT